MRTMKQAVWLFTLALLLSGCTALGLPQADTFNERLAVGYATVTTVRTTAVTLLNTKKISAEDGQNVLSTTDGARAGLDLARVLAGTNLPAAESKLTAARSILTAVQAYLASRGGN